MLEKMRRAAEDMTSAILVTVAAAAFVVVVLVGSSWAGPPGPPLADAVPLPRTPVGGTDISLATAAAIGGYAIWKSRR